MRFVSNFFNLLLVTFHQEEIIIVKHLIQGRYNEARAGVEPNRQPCEHGRRKNDAPNPYAADNK